MIATDATHDPALQSWVSDANQHVDFPIQNLPFGIFSVPNGEKRAGVAIGNHILDLTACMEHGLFAGDALRAAQAAHGGTLNALMALGTKPRRALRLALAGILARGSAA